MGIDQTKDIPSKGDVGINYFLMADVGRKEFDI